MICSVLIPSRARPDRLAKAIESIQETVDNPDDVEILVRIDDDDLPSLLLRCIADGSVRSVVGPRLRGYASVPWFYRELAAVARGTWAFMMNDDATIIGQGWDTQLKALPTSGLIVQPQIYQLGLSAYPHCEGGAFPFVPNRCWELYGDQDTEMAIDTYLDQLLRVQHGWTTHFLPGITVVHDRDPDDVLDAHRKMS